MSVLHDLIVLISPVFLILVPLLFVFSLHRCFGGYSSLLHLGCAVTSVFIKRSAVILRNSLLLLLWFLLCVSWPFLPPAPISTFFVFAGLIFLCQGYFVNLVVEVWWTQTKGRRPAVRNKMEARWCKKKLKPYLYGANCTNQKCVEYKKKAEWPERPSTAPRRFGSFTICLVITFSVIVLFLYHLVKRNPMNAQPASTHGIWAQLCVSWGLLDLCCTMYHLYHLKTPPSSPHPFWKHEIPQKGAVPSAPSWPVPLIVPWASHGPGAPRISQSVFWSFNNWYCRAGSIQGVSWLNLAPRVVRFQTSELNMAQTLHHLDPLAFPALPA